MPEQPNAEQVAKAIAEDISPIRQISFKEPFVDAASQRILDHITPILARAEAAEQRATEREAFKTFVHKWLDDAGVPHDPDAEHNKECGCRIKGRLEWLRQRAMEAERDAKELRALFDLQQARMEAATKIWQEATGKTNVLPDLGNLLAWVLNEREVLIRQRDELAKVVEKLPKTADGVPITPGMTLYVEHDLGGVESFVAEAITDGGKFCLRIRSIERLHASECYSTREAALAAQSPAIEDQGG